MTVSTEENTMQNTGMQGSTQSGATRFAENMAEKAGTSLGQLQQSAQQTMDRVTEAASQAAQRLSAHSDELWAMQDRAWESTRAYVRQHPIASIGIAIAIGLILSRLTSRR
jgi:ElaB/YqjD/DUF883 family membrane-anchored ribosome-binding protein